MATCPVTGGRDSSRSSDGYCRPAIAVVLILTLIAGAETTENAEAGTAMWWLVPGALLFTLTVHSEGLRRLWFAAS